MAKLKNPTGKTSSFYYGGQEKVVEPGESKPFPPEVIEHYTSHINGPLEVIDDKQIELEEAEEVGDIENMKWKKLIELGKKLKVYEFGMNKEELIGEIRRAGNSS